MRVQVEFIQYIKSIPSEEGRQAELALFRRLPEEAERILLQASPPLIYRAIKLNLNLFRWGRALDLALKHKQHVETVLAYRQKYLEDFGRDETDQRYLQYLNQVMTLFVFIVRMHVLFFGILGEIRLAGCKRARTTGIGRRSEEIQPKCAKISVVCALQNIIKY